MKNKLLLLTLLPSITLASPTKLDTILKDVYGQTNMQVYINCVSSVEITSPGKYVIGTRVCAENQGCQDHRSDLKIDDGKTFSNVYQTVYMPTFKRAGNKQITCTNYIEGDLMATQVKYATAYIS